MKGSEAMRRRFTTHRRVALVSALVAALAATTSSPSTPVVHADGPQVWWVAATGSATTPASNGSSCASPSYVGATDSPIQAAINGAASGDEIRICSGTYLLGATITIGTGITITGEGSTFPILDGQDARRIVDITTGGISVSFDKIHFQNGRVTGDSIRGGAIQQHPNANLTVTDSYFYNNRAMNDHGGAISMIGQGDGSNTGVLSVVRSTFYKNSGLDGGAIVVVGNQTPATIVNSTFVSNTAQRNGGAINGSFANVSASNSTFIDNTAPDGGDNSWIVGLKGSLIAYSSTVTRSSDVCVFGDNGATDNVSTESSCMQTGDEKVSLASLDLRFIAPWGGLTPTVSLGATSSAIDAIDSTNCPATDQRGESRSGSTCDAGAFEYRANPGSISTTSVITVIQGRPISPVPTFTKSGLTEPVVFRVATELSGPLPGGVTVASGTGQITGTPTSTSTASMYVVTATDADGRTVSAQLPVENCVLTKTDGTYRITNRSDLDVFRVGVCGLDADYVQTADIAWNGAWKDTSTPTAPFKGSLDGGGRSITGLQITGGETAFLAHTLNARISHLRFAATVSGGGGTAALVRYATSTTITGVRGTGSVTNPATESTQGCVGGLVGEADVNTTITNSSWVGTVTAPAGSWIGGLIGCAYSGTVVTGSYVDGAVSGVSNIGGLVGWMELTEITDSYALGSVKGTGTEIGGLVGWLDKDGPDEDAIAVRNSYASVTMEGTTSIGALIGAGESTSVTASFWEAGLSGIEGLSPIGVLRDTDGTQPGLTATPAASMKTRAVFADAGWMIVNGWADSVSSNDKWGICNGTTRPFLLWQHVSDPCPPPPPPPTTTTVPAGPTTTAPSTKPPTRPITVTTGGFVVVLGQTQSKSNFAWSGRSKIVGTAGKSNVTLMFDPRAMHPARRAWVNSGSVITLSVSGMKARSKATVSVTTQSLTLGSVTANAKGAARGSVTLSKRLRPGEHRLRIQLVGAKGQAITVWIGIYIR